jgi:serine-type D-Ala-D-Ala carboxypeptidase/endopeptidase (penicillin-binding protein 4)
LINVYPIGAAARGRLAAAVRKELPVPRLRRLAVAILALLCVFVIGAGLAVAGLLPRRLAQWDVPRVAARPVAAPQSPLAINGPRGRGSGAGGAASAGSASPGPAGSATTSGLRAALAPLLGAAALGPHVGLLVSDLSSGQVLYGRQAGTAFAPASTTKVATAVAALDALGPATRFSTSVVGSGGSIVLVGGGDPTLAAGTPPAEDYPRPATLAALAARTARALRAQGRSSVRLRYDTSLFSGPGMAPGWPRSYVTTGNVTPISSLEVDQGRLTASGAPQDADEPGNSLPRTFDPAGEAAHAFAGFLAADGIQVKGAPAAGRAPSGAPTLARVASPPVAQMVGQMLLESNNVIAEDLARQVAIVRGQTASFGGAAAAEMAVLRRLGVTGVNLVDGSGLSPRDRITPSALVALVALAASQDQPRLRAAITGLPVAGFSGTLAPGGSVFAEPGKAALGVVRAKTGNLNTVAALTGIAYARNGELLSFAVMADKLRPGELNQAGAQIARLATALARCGCGSP